MAAVSSPGGWAWALPGTAGTRLAPTGSVTLDRSLSSPSATVSGSSSAKGPHPVACGRDARSPDFRRPLRARSAGRKARDCPREL